MKIGEIYKRSKRCENFGHLFVQIVDMDSDYVYYHGIECNYDDGKYIIRTSISDFEKGFRDIKIHYILVDEFECSCGGRPMQEEIIFARHEKECPGIWYVSEKCWSCK